MFGVWFSVFSFQSQLPVKFRHLVSSIQHPAFGIKILILFTLLILSIQSMACRFTVREIGFSTLSRDVYTIAVVDRQANANDLLWNSYRNKNDINLRLEILHSELDAHHPTVKLLKSKNFTFPATFLISPDGKILELNRNSFAEKYRLIKDSPVREELREVFTETFAVVLWVKGKNSDRNNEAKHKIEHECAAIKNIIPNMPKQVKNGPTYLQISKEKLVQEQVLLWCLGVDSLPENPVAFVIYGRGRIIGEALSFQEIMEGKIYQYMSMIGADCECGLDRKWMLGRQIPFWWPAESRQHLTNTVGFDVNNPMILAEMSRILAKEKLSDANGIPSFAPETIDLNEAFGNEPNQKQEDLKSFKSSRILYYTLGILAFFILTGGTLLYFYQKKRQ